MPGCAVLLPHLLMTGVDVATGGDEAFRLQQMQDELATLQATKREYLQLR